MRFLRRLATRYFSSWWIPAALALALLLATTGLEIAGPYRFAAMSSLFAYAFAAAFLGILAAALWSFIRKRWLKGLLNLLALPVCGLALVVVSFVTMFGVSEDGFADHLTIPPDLDYAEPLPYDISPASSESDSLQHELLAALETPGEDDALITADVSSLQKLAREHPELLHRFLASHPAWRVYVDAGKRLATRRWKVGNRWQWTLHGYYTRHNLDPFNETGLPYFQTRGTLGLDGKPFFENADSTRLKPEESAPLQLRTDGSTDTSQCVIESAPLAVEIFEQRDGQERRITKATLALWEKEFAALLADPRWEKARELLPTDAITSGEPFLELRNSFQGGIYNVTIRANPGEPGRIFLQAFEVTKGIQLSERRLEDASGEWIGWSDNPDEQFLSNSVITIYEGDWEKYYAARFEVWFAPDSGAPPRKLLERVYKIEGWMR